MIITKGAMFGLDARIALAIFGALSVISGAALYSAIQQSKVVGLVTAGQEVLKAVESYMVDTGSDLPKDDNHTRVRKFLELEESSVAGWKGPYLSDRSSGVVSYSLNIYNPTTGYIEMLNDKTWGDSSSIIAAAECTAGDDDCYYWLVYVGLTDAMAIALDEYIDGSTTRNSGNVRLVDSSNAGDDHAYVKGPRLLTQP